MQSMVHNGLRLRAAALVQLWLHRSHWRLPLARARMQHERDTQLVDLMPTVLVISLIVGVLLFVTLPAALGGSYLVAFNTLWPIWVVQIAPMAAALALAMQRAPTLALELSQRQSRGEFDALARLQAGPAAYPCISVLMAHAWVSVAASFLLIGLTLVLGVMGSLVTAKGDLRQSLDAVFSLVTPLQWVRSLCTAWLLGFACSLSSMLYAWPGTQTSAAGVDAHRLGLRTMMVSSMATIICALTLNWVMGLLGFLKWW